MKVTKELRELSNKELEERMVEFKKELLKLNVQVANGSAASSSGKIRQLKKNIARVLTLLNEKNLKENKR